MFLHRRIMVFVGSENEKKEKKFDKAKLAVGQSLFAPFAKQEHMSKVFLLLESVSARKWWYCRPGVFVAKDLDSPWQQS